MLEALGKELANRRCIVFLGSGASASSTHSREATKHTPTWAEFLRKLNEKIAGDNSVKIEALIAEKKYLEAAELIRIHINSADYALVLRDQFTGFVPSKIHEIIAKFDQYVVMTTNYDKIYDNFCQKGVDEGLYTTCKYYETKLVSDLRSSKRLIVKLHGCLDDPEKTILSKSDYYQLRKEHSRFFDVVNAMFLTHTVLFVGYSLDDPDIQLILENTNITAQSTFPHYAILQKYEVDDKGWYLEKIHNTRPIPYENGRHSDVIDILTKLLEIIDIERTI